MPILLLSALLLISLPAQADPVGRAPIESVEALSAYFRTQLTKIDSFAASAPPPSANPAFPLRDINIDIAPSVIFGLNGFLSLAVSPEIDFILVPDPAPAPLEN